ncbi:MarR family winged helix-turn-helix transcriptional regulator [Pectinatus sottacetonis]|uniref:MarR family winged helix-turn-helix transcriptional regulator n=1 Tax=Pectinatus sottacetonis TaxID=1002795 RepID=UPI0018C4CAAB|nr:MarR family transcriptional regulator [Pectinatus sottacetonis]
MIDKRNISDDFLEMLFLLRHRIFRHISIPLPINQFVVLCILTDEGSMTFSEIGKRLSIIKQQLSPIINKLEENNLVKRLPDSKDRRRIKIQMTPKGRKFITEHQNKIKAHLETNLSVLSEKEIEEFGKSLKTLMKLFGKISLS